MNNINKQKTRTKEAEDIWGGCMSCPVLRHVGVTPCSPVSPGPGQEEGPGGDQGVHHPVPGQRGLPDQRPGQQRAAAPGHPGLAAPTHGVLHQPHLPGQDTRSHTHVRTHWHTRVHTFTHTHAHVTAVQDHRRGHTHTHAAEGQLNLKNSLPHTVTSVLCICE